MSDSLPPPIYSQRDPENSLLSQTDVPSPQILIIPTADTVDFQNGFLGADDERAAIEGELQIKGVEPGQCAKLNVALRTVEGAYSREVELGHSEIILFPQPDVQPPSFPLSFPFSIPLTADTPQSLQTPCSYLSHYLTAELVPADPRLPTLSKSFKVHTRRYVAHTHALLVDPETHSLDDPTRIEVQVPRSTFMVDEVIPVYVTVPPPPREIVLDRGLRLRNVQVELVRIVHVKQEPEDDVLPSRSGGPPSQPNQGPSTNAETDDTPELRKVSGPALAGIQLFRSVVARSGASCRFHSSRTVKLRFILHPESHRESPSNIDIGMASPEYGHRDAGADIPSITQSTLLHSISFQLNIQISFVNVSTHTERISVISVPVTMLPSAAPLPEVSRTIDEAYQKKHDRPPARTVRQEDTEYPTPHYYEGEAGPSILPNGAPPPFEERDAPPPFFVASEPSTSNRLPTFLESESEIIIPEPELNLLSHTPTSPFIFGEGSQFGFPSSEQFDGHTEDMQRSTTPPPPLEMASRDTDLTMLADMPDSDRGMDRLALTLSRPGEDAVEQDQPPPPPPAMDDPSDPPPCIDLDYRLPDPTGQPSHGSPPQRPPYTLTDNSVLHLSSAQSVMEAAPPSHGHAPPPYLVPENHADHENVMRPPPYVD